MKIATVFIATCVSMASANGAFADCVVGAKMKTSFVVLGPNTLLLKGGGRDILIKSFHFFYTSSQVTVLKDSFCDFENNVLFVDGETVDVQQVKQL